MESNNEDRRKYARGDDLFTRLENLTYELLRRSEQRSLSAPAEPSLASPGEGGAND